MRQRNDDAIRQIRSLRNRAIRAQEGVFYAEGNRIVAQALAAGRPIELAVYAPELITSDLARDTVNTLADKQVPLLELGRREFDRLSFKSNPSGVAAIVRSWEESCDGVAAIEGNWVALDRVGNAGNLGAIMRTCDAVGVEGIVLLGDTTDPYHPDAVRASMGSLFVLRLLRGDLTCLENWRSTLKIPITGISGDGRIHFKEYHYPSPGVLLMGSERLGVSDSARDLCDALVYIPMQGSADSLNLAVATSVVLYEQYDQHAGR